MNFTTSSLYVTFRGEGHNQRTREAFNCGVRRGALGEPLIYGNASSDYAAAERAGRDAALRLIRDGGTWICDECGAAHPAPPAEMAP